MRLEQIPLLVGVVVAILGLGLVLDAQLPDGVVPSRERRRSERAERHRGGETMVGLGILALSAALVGRDTWRFGTVAALVGVILLAAGTWLNREYLGEMLTFRGPARRGEKRAAPRAAGSAFAPADVAMRATASPPVAPGLADTAPPRDPGALRGDREAPIMTATDGAPPRNAPADDAGPDGPRRVRIR